VGDRDEPLDIAVEDHHVVDTDRIDDAAVEVAIRRGEHDLLDAVF
jgi:hypothetical protein